VIFIDGPNVTLNGYDLTHVTVMINNDSSGTVTISNCIASQGVNIRSDYNGDNGTNMTTNLVVTNCSFDGGGTASNPDYQTIKVWCPSVTVQYCWIYDSPAAIQTNGSGPAIIQYNLLDSFDYNPPDHANAIYIAGPNSSSVIQYNTIWSGSTHTGVVNGTPVPVGLGAAIAAFTDGGSISNIDISHNTIISAMPDAASYLIGLYTYSGANGYTATGSIDDNYVASINGFNNQNSGAFGAFYPLMSGAQATVFGNIDLANGNLINGDNSETVNTSGGGSPPPSPPAAPVISSFSPDTGGVDTTSTITLSGTAEAGSTVTVFDGTTNEGTATVNASRAWTFTETNAANGTHTFTATDTDANGTSVASAAFNVTVNVPAAPPPPSSANLVINGDFETGDFTGWMLSGNVAPLSYGPQTFITSNAESGQYAAGLGSVGSDGTLSQNIQTTAGQNYTLDFWLANAIGGPDDFTVKWNGQTLLALNNASAQGYTEYTFNVVGTAGTSNLEFDFRQDPASWSLDNISVTAAGSQTANVSVQSALLSQYIAASNGAGASTSTPPILAQSSSPSVTLVNPVQTH
jgi:hypothetical protein